MNGEGAIAPMYMYPPHTERELVKTGAIQALGRLLVILDQAEKAIQDEPPEPPADTLQRVLTRVQDSIGRVSIINGTVVF